MTATSHRSGRKFGGSLMSNYVVSRLQPGETLVYRGRVSKVALLFRPTFFILLTFIIFGATGSNHNGPNGAESSGASVGSFFAFLFLVIAIIGFIRAALFIRNSEYVVTDRRVVGKFGSIRVHSVDVMMTNIAGADIQQGFFARIFHYGNLTIKGSGSTRALPAIADPTAFQHAVYGQLEMSKLLKGTAGYTLDVRMAPDDRPESAVTSPPISTPSSSPNQVFCSQCGNSLAKDARFCSSCRAAVAG
jgi:membrane protein YdbS with pleckstrin-like domain